MGLARDIARRAVGVAGQDEELLRAAGQVHPDLARKDFQLRGPAAFDVVELAAIDDPLADSRVVFNYENSFRVHVTWSLYQECSKSRALVCKGGVKES